MVISLSPVKRKKKKAFWLNIWFTLLCHNFKFFVIYAFFSANSVFPKFQSSQKNGFFQVCLSRVPCHMSNVKTKKSKYIYYFYLFFGKVVKLFGGGSRVYLATPYSLQTSYMPNTAYRVWWSILLVWWFAS